MHRPSLHNIVFDLEATCWNIRHEVQSAVTDEERYKQENEMEIIQIGAYKVHYKTFEIMDYSFDMFVKPVLNPILTDYCKNLTNITQEQIDNLGLPFHEAYSYFMDWADNPRAFIGWGNGDYELLRYDCIRHHKRTEEEFRCFPRYKYVNGKSLYQYWKGIRSKGLQASVDRAKLKFEGIPHNALADAKMTVQVLREAWLNF